MKLITQTKKYYRKGEEIEHLRNYAMHYKKPIAPRIKVGMWRHIQYTLLNWVFRDPQRNADTVILARIETAMC